MKTNKIGLLTILLFCFITCAFWARAYTQGHEAPDKAKLAAIINSAATKMAIADTIDGIPNIIFDMDTLAYDPFRDHILVATLDFEHIPSGIHGTASLAYEWIDSDFVRIYTSYFLWGTAVSGNISADTTWNSAGSPYYITDNTTVEHGVTLTIEPGTVVKVRKFNNRAIEIEVLGILICQGATFTSSCDFENYDNSQVTWNDCDWTGINFYREGAGTVQDSVIEYAQYGVDVYSDGGVSLTGNTFWRCSFGVHLSRWSILPQHTVDSNDFIDCYEAVVCYQQSQATTVSNNTFTSASKWGAWAAIYCDDNSSPAVTSNIISGQFSYGIRCRNNSSPEISANTVENNNHGIITVSGSNPLVINNNIAGNITYGLSNSDSMIILVAENNWWGDATGPYHWSLNPGGLGDPVSDSVDFEPWLTSAVTMLFIFSP